MHTQSNKRELNVSFHSSTLDVSNCLQFKNLCHISDMLVSYFFHYIKWNCQHNKNKLLYRPESGDTKKHLRGKRVMSTQSSSNKGQLHTMALCQFYPQDLKCFQEIISVMMLSTADLITGFICSRGGASDSISLSSSSHRDFWGDSILSCWFVQQ